MPTKAIAQKINYWCPKCKQTFVRTQGRKMLQLFIRNFRWIFWHVYDSGSWEERLIFVQSLENILDLFELRQSF